MGYVAYQLLKKEQKEENKKYKNFGNKTQEEILSYYKNIYVGIKKDDRLPNLKRDKFRLDDIAKNATQFVYDYPIHEKVDIDKLKKGDYVKLIFIDATGIGERIWVIYDRFENGLHVGMLANDFFEEKHELTSGKVIYFHSNHIFQIDYQ